MATLDNASILRQAYEAWNDKDLDRTVSYALPDARVLNVPFGASVSYREYLENWARAFPDGKIDLINVIAQGDYVVGEFTGRGTHTGPLRGPAGEIAATGRHVEMPFVEVYRFRNGRIAEGRTYFDGATFMEQLGLAAGAGVEQARGAAAPPPRPRH